jgi:hypothetical protein
MALIHLGANMIATLTDNSKNAVIMNFLYDKCRQDEARAHGWQFNITYLQLVPSISIAGPSTVTFQNGAKRNAFLLPYAAFIADPVTSNTPYPAPPLPNAVAAYLRLASQLPHTASNANQGVSAGVQWSDYQVEGYRLLTSQSSVLLRYFADNTNVAQFDAMYCNAVALRIAWYACETITQNANKRIQIGQMYAEQIALARRLNLIETATDEPVENEILLTRIGTNPNPPAPQQRQR